MASSSTSISINSAVPSRVPVRVFGFIDGFNLYHALDRLDRAADLQGQTKYHQYKWLCLRTLIGQFIREDEVLAGVEYFSAYPNWPGSESKKRRHELYVSALRSRGVNVTLGEFKRHEIECRNCRRSFEAPVEKQTDINIALSLIQRASEYDKAILLTADSDQVAVIKSLRGLHPEKQFVSLAPIGRSSKELAKACGSRFNMTEQHLIDSQLPSPMAVVVNGKDTGNFFVKPAQWSAKLPLTLISTEKPTSFDLAASATEA